MSELQNFLNLPVQLMCSGWGSATGTGAVWGEDGEDWCASRKVYHGHPLLKSSTGSSFLGCWGNRRDSEMFQCQGASSTLGLFWSSSQPLQFSVNIWFWCPTANKLGLTHWRGSFGMKHLSLSRTFPSGRCGGGHGRALPPPSCRTVAVPLCSSSSRCAVSAGSCIFLLPGTAPLATGEQGELQVQAGGKKQCKVLSMSCISWAPLPGEVYSVLPI